MQHLMISEQVVFYGEVQGVGFRWSLSRLAREQELAGWVRNLPDGSVEAVFQGDRPKIQSVLQRMMLVQGRIRITRMEQRKLELPAIAGFNVR